MSHLLVCATPAPGHVNPMLTIATSLAERGHEITFITAEPFRSRVEAAGGVSPVKRFARSKRSKGIRFVPFSGLANFDYARLHDHFGERSNIAPGPALLSYDFQHIFGDTIPDQHRTIQSVLQTADVDLILTDATFFGTAPLLLGSEDNRPPIISIGMMPLMLTSRDRPPFGAPSGNERGGRDYLEEHRVFQANLQGVDEHLNCVLSDMNCQPLRHFFLDSMHSLPDRFLQLTGERFEYPCSDLPSKIRFVGPLLSKSSSHWVPPDWWPVLDEGEPVVVVTQGTISNTDLSELIEPTMQALAHEDITLIVSLATHEKRTLNVPVAANTIVMPFVPFEHLLPKASLFITNGGYGAVSQALQFGVPMVVAGATEDKPFVAARVAWSGTGIDLQTNRPTTGQIYAAARRILTDNSFRQNAAVLSHSFEQYDALERIALEVEDTIASFEGVCELSQVTVA